MSRNPNPPPASFRWTFLFGQGADFAGHVDSIGSGVTNLAPGDEVLGWSERRSAQAEYVVVSGAQLIAKPPALDWSRAGSLFVVATTAVAAVHAVSLKPGDVVAVSGAAGGVGSLAVHASCVPSVSNRSRMAPVSRNGYGRSFRTDSTLSSTSSATIMSSSASRASG